MKSQRTLIIAEIGENHIGDMKLAKRMIEQAAEAGADIVKFQSYLGKDFKDDDPEKEWFTRVELSNEAHFELKEFAEQKGVEFLSSPFSIERARFLVEELGLKRIKVASGVMMKFDMLDYLNNANIDALILSTGLATIREIKESLTHLKNIAEITILHCTTQYPCDDKDANLLAIRSLQNKFSGFQIGYSDHTVGIDACVAAVALGATMIEKHYTFDKHCTEGTDHILSATADEFKDMVKRIRRIEDMLGTGTKQPSESEKEIIEFVRNRFP